MNKLLENIVNRLAIKKFSQTVVWIEFYLILLLIIFCLSCVLFLFYSIDITIPIKVESSNKIIVSNKYFSKLTDSNEVVLKYKNKIVHRNIKKTLIDSNTKLALSFDKPIENLPYRLLIGRKKIIDMLLKRKTN
jgi:hypothetical protein